MTRFSDDDLDEIQLKPRRKDGLTYLPTVARLPAWLTAAFRPQVGFEFEEFDRLSNRMTDPCSITFRNGRERRTFRFDRQADLHGASLRAVVVGVSAGWLQMPHLTPGEIEDVWVALCTIGRVMSEHDERDDTRKWIEELLDASVPLEGHTLDPDGRHDALMAIRENGEFHQIDARALTSPGSAVVHQRPVRFVDKETGDQWLRAGETYRFVYWVCGAQKLDRSGLKARLAAIGVESRRFEAYQAPHPKAMLYRLTPELLEYIKAKPGTQRDAAES